MCPAEILVREMSRGGEVKQKIYIELSLNQPINWLDFVLDGNKVEVRYFIYTYFSKTSLMFEIYFEGVWGIQISNMKGRLVDGIHACFHVCLLKEIAKKYSLDYHM